MGIGIDLYRARIGRFAGQGRDTEKKLTLNSLNATYTCAALFSLAIVLGLAGGALVGAVVSSNVTVALLESVREWGGALFSAPDSACCLEKLNSTGIDLLPSTWKITMPLIYSRTQWNWSTVPTEPVYAPALILVGNFTGLKGILQAPGVSDLVDGQRTMEEVGLTYLTGSLGTSLLPPRMRCQQVLCHIGNQSSKSCLGDGYSQISPRMEGYS